MRKPIFYHFDDGMMFYAVLKAGAEIRVAIEHLDGRPYHPEWSVPAGDVVLQPLEFVARTWGDHHGLMASAMLGTGWFERTGGSYCTPTGEIHEIWRLSPLGVAWLDAAVSTAL